MAMSPLESVLRRNNVNEHGRRDGQPMLFVHGFGCDQNMWRNVWPAFAQTHRTVLVDLTGMGRADSSAYDKRRHATLHGHAKDMLQVVDALGLRDVVFVGHSVATMIGVLAAIERPQVFSRLVLVGPSPSYINDGSYVGGWTRQDIDGLLETLDQNYLGWSAAVAPIIMGRPDRPEYGEELRNMFCQNDPGVLRHFARVTFLGDYRRDLPKAQTPALVLQCSSDAIAPEAVGRYVAQRMPNARFELMQATGHCPNLSAPQETVEKIQAYLRDR